MKEIYLIPPGESTQQQATAKPATPHSPALPQDVHESLRWLHTLCSPHYYLDRLGPLDKWIKDNPLQHAMPATNTKDLEAEITKLIEQRDEREAVIDQLCDAVLGDDRPEWSSVYFFSNAVADVESHMAGINQAKQMTNESAADLQATMMALRADLNRVAGVERPHPTGAAQ